jgi:hypothetical protein
MPAFVPRGLRRVYFFVPPLSRLPTGPKVLAATSQTRGSTTNMCDYSLHTYSNRLAADGEDLVVHRFGAGSLGLACPADLAMVNSAAKTIQGSPWSRIKTWFLGKNPRWEAEKRVAAVCVPPGSRLLLSDIPKNLQRELRVGELAEVQFVEITAEVNTYRDAVRFPNGRQALLQQLREGQRVRVISIGVEEFEPAESLIRTAAR